MEDGGDSVRSGTFSATDVAIIEALRRGAGDLEIAAEVGHRAAWVSARIHFLTEVLGVSGREGLAAWSPQSGGTAAPPPAPEHTVAHSTKLTRRALLAAGGVAAFTGAAALIVRARSRGGGEDHAAPSTPVDTAPPPAPTATPVGDVSRFFEDGSPWFEKISFAPGDLIEADQGIFFMDTATGAIEGWRILPDMAGNLPGAYHYALHADASLVFLKVVPDGLPGREFVLDRETGSAVTFKPLDISFVAAHGELLVFEETGNRNGDVRKGCYHLIRRSGNSVEQTAGFEADVVGLSAAPMTALSPDGSALFLTNQLVGHAPGLVRWDIASGKVTSLFEATDEQLAGRKASFTALRPLSTGRGVALFVTSSSDDPAGETRRRAVAFDWSGAPIPSGSIPPGDSAILIERVGGSPDGRLLATNAPLRLVGGELWPALTVTRPTAQSPEYLLRGVSLGVGAFSEFNPWLPDSSGFVAWIPDEDAATSLPSWERRTPAIVSADGRVIAPLPSPAGWAAENRTFGPAPSPRDPALFSYSGTHVYSRTSGRWLSANLKKHIQLRLDPWSGRAGEMVFALPRGSVGIGSDAEPVLLPRRREPAPFDGDLRLRVRNGYAGVTLLDGFETGAANVASVAAGRELVLAELPPGQLPNARRAVVLDRGRGITWIRVSDGSNEGWVDSTRLDWA